MLVDRHGKDIVVEKAAVMQNADPALWFSSDSGASVAIADIEKQPYKFYWTIYACARVIVKNISRLPRFLTTLRGESKKITEHEVLKLLAKPNPALSRTSFYEQIGLNLLLPAAQSYGKNMKGGECFIVGEMANGNKADFARGDIPLMLFCFNSSMISPAFSEQKKWIGWNYSVPNTSLKTEFYRTTEVIRIFNLNPYNILEGLSPISSVQLSMVRDIKADLWNSRMYDNDAIPQGVLKSDQQLNETDAREISTRWYEKYGGPGNTRRVAVLGKGVEFQNISVAAKDMEFSEQKNKAMREIISVMGLNKIALGDYEQINRATIEIGRLMLWEDTYLPIDEQIMEAFNSQWINNIDPRQVLELKADTSGVSILKKQYDKQVVAAKTMYDMGVPAATAFRVNEVPITEEDISNAPWLLEKPIPAVAPVFPLEEEKPEPEKAVKTGFVYRLDKDERDKFSMSYIEKVLDPGEKTMVSRLIKFFIRERNEMQDNVDEWLKRNAKSLTKALVNPAVFLLDISEEADDLIKTVYRPQVIEQLKREKVELIEELGDVVEWNVTDPLINSYVNARRAGMKRVIMNEMKTVSDQISDAVEAGTAENATIAELASSIKQAIADVGEQYKNQSVTIARTETGIISSKQRFETFKDIGAEYKQWINAHDEKVRDSHRDGTGDGGKIIGINDIFPSTGLMYPLEAGGAAGEVINCVLPGTIVSGSFVAALKSFYSGKAIELTTRNGNRVCVTVNHPISTDRGFVPAYCIKKGDDIVCHRGDVGTLSSGWYADKQNGESRVEDVFNTIAANGTSWIKTPSGFDLDGDGKFLREQINLVARFRALSDGGATFDSSLMSEMESPFVEFGNKFDFISSNVTSLMSALRPGFFGPSSSGPSCGKLSRDRVGVLSDMFPFKEFRFGAAADMCISRYQYAADDASAYASFLRDLIFAHPGEVFLDDVVDVRTFDYSGHVYDLQSKVGYFNSNNILSRNCRCSLILVSK